MATETQARGGLFATKPVDALIADTEEAGSQLNRAVGLLDLTALGIGAIIGTGIFVILGEAIGDAGPAIILSFVLAGVTCASPRSPTPSWRPRSRSAAPPTRTATRPWGSSSPGSSAGT